MPWGGAVMARTYLPTYNDRPLLLQALHQGVIC